MAAASNGDAAPNTPVPGRLASIYSELQTRRISRARCPSPPLRPPLPLYTRRRASQHRPWKPDEIAKLFSSLYSQPSAAEPVATKPLNIDVVLPGGQASGGQLICGIFDNQITAGACQRQHHVWIQGRHAGVMKGN